jgi:hypothetical protein
MVVDAIEIFVLQPPAKQTPETPLVVQVTKSLAIEQVPFLSSHLVQLGHLNGQV